MRKMLEHERIPALLTRLGDAFVFSPDGCWVWQRGLFDNGYGALWFNGTNCRAHRVIYELVVGPIPDGLTLDHRCHTDDASCEGGVTCLHRRCVNPAHMELVTLVENVMRGVGISAANARKTHCKHGHEFTPGNTIVASKTKGGRHCRACRDSRNAASSRRYRERLKSRGLSPHKEKES